MFALAHFLANAINPILGILLLIAPLVVKRRIPRQIAKFWAASAIGVAVSVLLAEEGKRMVVLAGHPGFPSGHETFALACAVNLLCWRTAYIYIALPLVLIIGWALVTAHFHQTIDIFGALITGPWPSLLCQAWRRHKMAARPQ